MVTTKINWKELISLNLTTGYFHHYRYLRSKMLEHNQDNIEETIPNLTDAQKESIQCMLQVELVVNAVMYSQDLAVILLCLNKPLSKFTTMISSLHETGSGSVKEFFEKILRAPPDFFWKMMHYDELEFQDKSEKGEYEKSCQRFQIDLSKVSKFFLEWYNLFSAYKHGLNIVPLRDTKTAKDILMLGKPDGTLDIYVVSPSWYLRYIEVIEMVYNMFNKLVEPLMWKLLAGIADVDLKRKETIKKLLTSDLPEEEKKGVKRLSLNVVFPWRIREPQEPKQFY